MSKEGNLIFCEWGTYSCSRLLIKTYINVPMLYWMERFLHARQPILPGTGIPDRQIMVHSKGNVPPDLSHIARQIRFFVWKSSKKLLDWNKLSIPNSVCCDSALAREYLTNLGSRASDTYRAPMITPIVSSLRNNSHQKMWKMHWFFWILHANAMSTCTSWRIAHAVVLSSLASQRTTTKG